MGGRGSAAAADDRRARLDERNDVARKLLRTDGEDSASVDDLRQAGVRLDGDRQRSCGGEPLYVLEHPVGAKAAVEPNRVDAQPLEERGDALRVGAGEELAVVAERDGGEHWERRVLLRRENGGLELVCVAHRLDHDEVRASGGSNAHLLGERVVGGVELEVAGGLEEAASRADVQRNKMARARLVRGARRLLSDAYRGGDDVRKRNVAMVLGGVGAERVRVDSVRAGGEVSLVHGAYVVRAPDVPELRNLAGLHPFQLELGAHSAVEEEDARAVCKQVFHFAESPFLTPITALTDFDGTMRRESVSDMPAARAESRSPSIVRCAERGKSP